MKGNILSTAEIMLESNKNEWRLLANGLIKKLETSGIITISTGRKIRVQLKINCIIPPEYSSAIILNEISDNLNKELSSGIERITTMFYNRIEKSKWIFIGEIKGKNNIPIVIIYNEFLNISYYSIKLVEESNEKFLPSFKQN
jgi:hypothetical protein